MCNIAGYVGEKRAAPILLEMIRRQEVFDGGCCAGIVTIHEGRFYMRKVVGSLEDLIKNTDAYRKRQIIPRLPAPKIPMR